MAISQQNYLQNKPARPDLIYELLFVIPWAIRLNMLTRNTEDIKKKKKIQTKLAEVETTMSKKELKKD